MSKLDANTGLHSQSILNSQLIIFDWDGTLIDSHDYIIDSMQLAAQSLSINVPDRQSIANIIGMSMDPAIVKLFPELNTQQVTVFKDTYTNHYNNKSRQQSKLFEGVYAGLASLKSKGYILAIATGKRMPGLMNDLISTDTQHFFTELRTADAYRSKPNPEMAISLLNSLDIEADHALMVGDNVLDIQMGIAAGVKSIGLTTGSSSSEAMRDAGASICFPTFNDFVSQLNS